MKGNIMTDTDVAVASIDEKREEKAEAAAPKEVVLGGQAAAALRERRAAANQEVMLYEINGSKFKVQFPLSAATLIYVSEMMGGDDGLDYKIFAKAISSLFAYEDQEKVMNELTRADAETVADVEYLSDIFQEIMEAVNGRPTNSQPS
jgi:hypothetical protein